MKKTRSVERDIAIAAMAEAHKGDYDYDPDYDYTEDDERLLDALISVGWRKVFGVGDD